MLRALILLLMTLAVPALAQAPLPRAAPEQEGLSPERLAQIGIVLNQDIADGKLPGGVLAIARHGKLVFLEAYGWRDRAAAVRMTTDTIFNIASMTKPMTTVTALTQVEAGHLVLDEPVGAYLPGRFADMKVAQLAADGSAITGTVPAARPITVRDLLTHTSGLIYGGRGSTAVHRLYPGGSADAAMTLTADQFLDRLNGNPLLNQPGATWDYGFGLDVTGLIVERLTGKPLGAAMADAVFNPLGMTDSGFAIPADKAARYARALPGQTVNPDAREATKFACGGGCAVSTATDYLRFATMLLNGGIYDGHRVLSPQMAAYMTTNQLGPDVRNLIGNADPTRAGYGFGLGLAVRVRMGGTRLMGAVGDFTWPGASGTNWWVDPANDLAVVFMAHTPGPARWHYRWVINAMVYAALTE